MVGDVYEVSPSLVYHKLIDFIVRDCESDLKVFRATYYVHCEELEQYDNLLLNYRVKTAEQVSLIFEKPVYIQEIVCDL